MHSKYGRYKYIYDNFEYLTGLDVDETMKDMKLYNHDSELDREEKDAINKLLDDRAPEDAKRIELDSVLKVVKAKMVEAFIIDKLQEFFPERKYIDRAITLPKEYFGEKFNILPENTRELFLRAASIADKAAKPAEDQIRKELENWSPSEEESKKGIPTLLVIPTEEMVNEMLMANTVRENPEMQELDRKAGELLDSLPPIEEDPDDDKN